MHRLFYILSQTSRKTVIYTKFEILEILSYCYHVVFLNLIMFHTYPRPIYKATIELMRTIKKRGNVITRSMH